MEPGTFKLLHCLLPTQDRIINSENPGLCQLCHAEVEDPPHAFFYCPYSRTAGAALLEYVFSTCPSLSPEACLRLELEEDLEDVEILATVYILATGLKYIWSVRVEKKQVVLFKMRAEIEAKISIIRKTRYSEAGDLMAQMLNIN